MRGEPMGVTRISEPPGPDDPLYDGVWFVFGTPSMLPTSDTSASDENAPEQLELALPVVGRNFPF